MARAAFARSELLVMDDCFSGLDANTEDLVFDNLLSKEGLLRKAKTTIVLASSDCECIIYIFPFISSYRVCIFMLWPSLVINNAL